VPDEDELLRDDQARQASRWPVLPDPPELTDELENEARIVLLAGFPAQWSSRMLEAWVGAVDKLRAERLMLLRKLAEALDGVG